MADNPYKDSPLVFRLPDGTMQPPTPELVAEFKHQCLAAAGAERPLDPGIHVTWDVFNRLVADSARLAELETALSKLLELIDILPAGPDHFSFRWTEAVENGKRLFRKAGA